MGVGVGVGVDEGVGSVDTVSSIIVVAADCSISELKTFPDDSFPSVEPVPSEQEATDTVSTATEIIAVRIFNVPR